MFYKNNYRPAMATAGYAPQGSKKATVKEGVLFNNASDATDDFGAFNSSSRSAQKKSSNAQKKPPMFEFNLKTILILAAALLAVVLLIVVFVSIANSTGSHLMNKNNAYLSYEIDGQYYVAVNGEVLDTTFENEISLVRAVDNSFAYVIEHTDDGEQVYILEKKELRTVLSSPVTEIITLAEQKPGIIYRKENGSVHFYTDDDEARITRNTATGNFIMSADGSAVVYTEPVEGDELKSNLSLYVDGSADNLEDNMVPVAVSNGGKYVYAYALVATETSISKKLYVIRTEEDGEKFEITDNFEGITYMNIKGDEIIYYTGVSSDKVRSHVYNAKKHESYEIGAGKCEPLIADPNVACLSTLKNIVVENTIPTEPGTSATHYIDKKYEASLLSRYNGILNTDGDTFYYIDKDDTLRYINLKDKTRTPEKIVDDVVDFVVTEKNNVYFIKDELDRDLVFYKSSTAKKRTIAGDVTTLSLNRYSNILYFSVDDDAKAYCTEEGSAKEIASFDRVEIPSTPVFVDEAQKRTYVYLLNPETDLYDVYYTASGNSYKNVARDCDSVNAIYGTGSFFDSVRDKLEEFFGSIGGIFEPETTPDSETDPDGEGEGDGEGEE